MSFRNWLLTGTSLTFLALSPLSVAHAQDGLTAAFQAFQADPSEANQTALTEACIAAGYASLDECIAALSGQAPVDDPAAAEEEPAADEPVAEEPAAEEPVAEEPVAEEPVAEEPVAEEPVAEEPVAEEPVAEEPVAEEPVTEEPVAEEPLAEEPVAGEPVAEEPVAEEPVAEEPVTEEAPAPAEEPVAEEPAVEEPIAEEPVTEEPLAEEPAVEDPASVEPEAVDPNADVLTQLTAAVDLYNQGVAQLDAGDASGQATVDTALAQINSICSAAGFADAASCVAQFGLTLNPLPPTADTPAADTPSVETPADDPAAGDEQPISELPGADEAVTDEATEVLPEDVPPEEAAPILDSEKDETAPLADDAAADEPAADEPAVDEPAADEPAADEPVAEEPAPTEPVAPPETDQAAQAELAPPPPEELSAATIEGEAVADFNFGFAAEVDVEEEGTSFVIPDEEEAEAEDIEIVRAPTADNPNFVFRVGIHIYINNVGRERDRFYDRDRDEIYYERLPQGRIREVIERPDGTRIITVYNRYGDVLKRTKIFPDNREFYLATYDFDEEDDQSFFIDPGDELPPLRLTISAREYILDADEADEEEVEFFLSQPPVEQVRRIYSIDEVKRSARIRDTVRRLEIGNLTFNTGEATIPRDQVSSLSKVANGMLALLEENPAEVFLIEGHTDAVGDEVSNLELSDERAATVARILTDFYDVPPENLTTQGYGERYLKVQTEDDEELNRRVTVKRITPLVTYETASN
ncbi:MAG TPA: OmpA family protein [Devosia sp.]|nr:OmpA family protein [Devosia sp.]